MKCRKTGKVCHPTEGGARKAKKLLRNCLLNIYPCRHCKGFHLGRSNNRYRNAERIDEILKQYDEALQERLAKNAPTIEPTD